MNNNTVVTKEMLNQATKMVKGVDNVNHPDHYAEGRQYEPIEVILDWDLGFNTGNAVKYISRAGRKGDAIEDLRKAIFYLNKEIECLSKSK